VVKLGFNPGLDDSDNYVFSVSAVML
jgi:hypothetical protein